MRFPLIAIAWVALGGGAPAQEVLPISVRTFERDGMGGAGTFGADDRRAAAPKGPPVISSTDQKQTYKHYDVDLTNRSRSAAKGLRMDYVIYTVSGDGRLISNSASAPVESLAAGARASLKTRGATLIRSKTTTKTVDVGPGNRVRTGSETSRSKERFGGIWVRVYAGDKLVGEGRDLTAELEKLKPAWKAPDRGGRPSTEAGISLPEIEIKPPRPPAKPPLPKPPF